MRIWCELTSTISIQQLIGERLQEQQELQPEEQIYFIKDMMNILDIWDKLIHDCIEFLVNENI